MTLVAGSTSLYPALAFEYALAECLEEEAVCLEPPSLGDFLRMKLKRMKAEPRDGHQLLTTPSEYLGLISTDARFCSHWSFQLYKPIN